MTNTDLLASSLRRATGEPQDTFPGWDGLLILANSLSPVVTVTVSHTQTEAFVCRTRDGRADILCPAGDVMRLAHELAHAVGDPALAWHLSACEAVHAAATLAREEARADRLARALCLPFPACCEAEPWEVAEAAGVSVGVVYVRLRELHG
jgi:hypothetical protein